MSVNGNMGTGIGKAPSIDQLGSRTQGSQPVAAKAGSRTDRNRDRRRSQVAKERAAADAKKK